MIYSVIFHDVLNVPSLINNAQFHEQLKTATY
jgi:hypothetical protein